MLKSMHLLFLLQVCCLLTSGYARLIQVNEGERIQEDEKSKLSWGILKPVYDGSVFGASVKETGSSNITGDQGVYASQDADSEPMVSVTIEPSWLSSYEDADELLENWDSEDEEQNGSVDSVDEKVVLRSDEAVPTSVASTEDGFSNVVYDRPIDIPESEGYAVEYPKHVTDFEKNNTEAAGSDLDPIYITPHTVEPRFEEAVESRFEGAVEPPFYGAVEPPFEEAVEPRLEEAMEPPFEVAVEPSPPPVEPQLPEFPPARGDKPTYVPIVDGHDTRGEFSPDHYQGRQRLEEDLNAELNREPPRSLHRSPVPWLQRVVNQVGQPRQQACQMELDRGVGPDEVSSWYYDSYEMRCRWFGYRGYGGNANRFASRAACEGYCIKDMENLCEAVQCSYAGTHCALVSDQPCINSAKAYGRDWRTKCPPEQPVCMSRRSTRIAPDIDFRSIPLECLQEQDPGSCERRNPSVMFHYDRERNDCMTFYFHDCGGNNNRFETKSDCMTHCSP